ncbi:MAG: ribonuclease R [Eubacteriales bacterium]|nr:ribonuclease R [Eubacteriales bacterium]
MNAINKDTVLRDCIIETAQSVCTPDDIIRALDKHGLHAKHSEIVRVLADLVDEGFLMRARSNRYGRPEAFGCLAGTFCATGRGYAFVRPESGNGPDVFIPPHQSKDAWHGDRVLIRVRQGSPQPKRGKRQSKQPDDTPNRQEGEVLRILNQARDDITGCIVMRGKMTMFRDDSGKLPEIVVSKKHLGDAHPGDRVALKVLFRGNEKYLPQGTVTQVFGSGLTRDAAAQAILYEHDISIPFSPESLAQAEQIPLFVQESDWQDRLDLRSQKLFTIDGDTAKDFDDAVSLETLPNGHYRLGVHIADVSHYVTEGSPLDREAYRRGTSVYYADQVIPMLPLTLSNGICSLNPGVNRLAFSVFVEVGKDGTRYSIDFHRSVICSYARLTYRQVNKILSGDWQERNLRQDLAPILDEMNALAQQLHASRLRRGALELNIPEAVVLCDRDGNAAGVEKRTRSDAESLIEEFMLVANEAVAEALYHANMPAIYRVHENPDPEKLRIFASQARLFGYLLRERDLSDTHQLQHILDQTASHPEQQALPSLLLRSLARARYDANCSGHYGLAAKYYLHFTSPIRRYPDLVVHRMLTRMLAGEQSSRELEAFCEEASAQSTAREQAAAEAEREIEKLYMAEYMSSFIGHTFDGYISSITSFGVYVQLDNMIEGMVRLDTMQNDWFTFDPDRLTLFGKHTGQNYHLGMRVNVTLVNASSTTGLIDFIFTPDEHAAG